MSARRGANVAGVARLSPPAIGQVVDGLREIAGAMAEIAAQRTRQAEIRAASAVQVAKIEATREVLLTYLERSFDERRVAFAELFARVDRGITAGDMALVAAALQGVVALAKSSPFEALRDVTATRNALEKKGTEWEF